MTQNLSSYQAPRHRLVSLNIRHGGGSRASSLAGWLLRQSPDFIILPEWRNNEYGHKIACDLQKEGFTVSSVHQEKLTANAILVGAKEPFELTRITPTGAEKGELGLAKFATFNLCAAYFPQLNEKAAFFNRCFELAENFNSAPLLIVGDLNTGRNDCDLEQGGVKFSCDGHFVNLETKSGLTDIWRAQHGASAREWTWRSSKNGFRIDHAFANEAFRTAFKKINCFYLHEPRESHVTDHSALVVDLSKSTPPA